MQGHLEPEYQRSNAWKVIWRDAENKKHIKRFNDDRPSHAVWFAKQLKQDGIQQVDVVSARKAFIQPSGQMFPPEPGMYWCPYCIKWRYFTDLAIKYEGWTSPILLRCPVCTISVLDYYVRKYNGILERFTLEELSLLRKHGEKQNKTPRKKRSRKSSS